MLFNRRKNAHDKINLAKVITPNQQGMATGKNHFSQTFRVDFKSVVQKRPITLEPHQQDTQASTAILKVYDAGYFPDGFLVPRHADDLFEKELTTYRLLQDMQGSSIPILYGSGVLRDAKMDIQGPFLLLEDIGNTEVDVSNWIDYQSVKQALTDIHSHGIAHCDIRLENMGKRLNGQIVIWDFASCVQLQSCSYSFQMKKKDWRCLHRLSVSSVKSSSSVA